MNAELDAANKELDSFSYSVSHDLRSPLRPVDGYSQIMQEDYADKLDDEGRRLLGVIRENSHKMEALINDLLAFSRLSRTPIAAVEIDMNRLIKEVLREPIAGGVGRQPQIKISNLPTTHGAHALIKQVWVNLLSNAIKFAGAKEQSVIEIGGYADGTKHVYYVKDNGAGFEM